MNNDECLARVAELKHHLAEARALLDWPERDTPPTAEEVEAGCVDWMYAICHGDDVARWSQLYADVVQPGAWPDGESWLTFPAVRLFDSRDGAFVSWSQWMHTRDYRFRRCTPDGKPALLPELK